jgi:anti-sigma regulatory factor (Ser/Thr protein kinase)
MWIRRLLLDPDMEQSFEPDPRSARAVRQLVTEAIPDSPHRDDIVLAVSELASNVIRHAQTAFTVHVAENDDTIRLEVSDGSSILPAVEQLNDSKRGLRLIEAVSEQWGVELTETGKTVWVEFAYPPGPP